MSRNDAGLAARADGNPAAARGVLAERLRARRAQQPEQEPRIRRPRGRLPRIRRAPRARRARADGVVRRPLPRREPDGRGRGATGRRGVLARVGVGVHRRRPNRQRCTRSRSCSSSSNPRSGATSRPSCAFISECGGRAARMRQGKLEIYTAEDVSPDMSFLEMLDVVNEQLIKKRRRAHRVRFRLPRRHLRRLRLRDQRPAARAGPRHDGLPAAHAAIQGWRHHHARALAGGGVSCGQRPGGGPERLRPHHSVRRLHVGEHRRRARRQCHTGIRGLPPRPLWTRRSALAAGPVSPRAKTRQRPSSRPPRSRTWRSCPRAGSRPGAASLIWWNEWTPKASGRVRTKGNVKRSAPRASRSLISGS